MKIGIIFGGSSREREISFVGGRTIYDNIDKTLFEPIPIFVDSIGNFILLNWEHIYKGTIRDFYPPQNTFESYFQPYIESLEKINDDDLYKIISKVGRRIYPHEFKNYIDFAFLTLHGIHGEDGTIQGMLEWYGIPYSGTGILGSSIGIDKSIQKYLITCMGNSGLPYRLIDIEKWLNSDRKKIFQELKAVFGYSYMNTLGGKNKQANAPFIAKSASQGSSIGVSVINTESYEEFVELINKCFFIHELSYEYWRSLTDQEKQNYISNKIIDVRYGIGLPLTGKLISQEPTQEKSEEKNIENIDIKELEEIIYTPDQILKYINKALVNEGEVLLLKSLNYENQIVIEQYIEGKEFSCIVIEPEIGTPIALPPTELISENNLYDYKAKYLPGFARKNTPIQIDSKIIDKIRSECEKLFIALHASVYSRIDGFLTTNNQIILNDPNTTSGMNPSSFLFHQSAEIGMTPTQFITFIISKSIEKSIILRTTKPQAIKKLYQADSDIINKKTNPKPKIKIGILLGGFSEERHVSLESGRNVYLHMRASVEYEPIPLFLSGNKNDFKIYQIPINILLKDNADDIHQIINNLYPQKKTEIIPLETDNFLNQKIQQKDPDMKLENYMNELREKFKDKIEEYIDIKSFEIQEVKIESLKDIVDFMFICVHGRPGEDGQIQKILENEKIAYNGSGIEACEIMMNKYQTNQYLKQNGISVTDQYLVKIEDWNKGRKSVLKSIEEEINYPLILKPVDEGCSAGMVKILDTAMLSRYIDIYFRVHNQLKDNEIQKDNFNIEEKELEIDILEGNNYNIPYKDVILVEKFVGQNNDTKLIEITGGVLTGIKEGKIEYEIFEPSEAVASNEILTLEEKFLAGEGQNITPARYHKDPIINAEITSQVKKIFKRVSKLLNIEGYARIDAFVRIKKSNEIDVIIIEVNTLPALTPATCLFHQSALSGYKPIELFKKIIDYGIEKNKRITK